MLDLGQVVLVKSLLASLNAVLGVGQNQGHQVPLQLIPNHVQVSQICRAHFVAGGGINRPVSREIVPLYYGGLSANILFFYMSWYLKSYLSIPLTVSQ